MQHVNDNYLVLIIMAMAGTVLLVILFILLQVRNQNRLLRQQKKMQQAELNHQKELLHAVIQSQEMERNRIGMDLHDEVGTILSSLRMTIQHFTDQAAVDTTAGQFNNHSRYLIDKAVGSVRSIAHNLSPFRSEVYGFTDALEDLCDRIHQPDKMNVALDCSCEAELKQLPGATTLALYRVITELINNTLKHAQATCITLSLSAEHDHLVVHYHDNGIGMPAGTAAKGMGLHNIESRLGMIGATYTIAPVNAGGFGIYITLPLANH